MTDDFQLCHRALGTEERRTSDSSVYHGNKGFLPVRLPEKRRGFVRVAEYTTEGKKKSGGYAIRAKHARSYFNFAVIYVDQLKVQDTVER